MSLEYVFETAAGEPHKIEISKLALNGVEVVLKNVRKHGVTIDLEPYQ